MENIIKLSSLLSIGDLIRIVAVGHERTAVVVDENERLHGVVSQGDILRAVWNGASISDSGVHVINPNPHVLLDGSYTNETAIDLFLRFGALTIPIVNQDRKLIRVLSVRHLLQNRFEECDGNES